MMSSVRDRLIYFIRSKGLSFRDFERSIGVANGYVRNISRSIQPDKIEKISQIYPDLSIEWLITGKGTMNGNIIHIDVPAKDLSHDELADYTVANKEAKDIANRIWLHGAMEEPNTRPRVPVTAKAGSLSADSIAVTLRDCEQLPVITQLPSYDFTIIVKGDSMSPKYESGDEIACRRILQPRFLQWGKVHVLDTSQGIVVKRIYEEGNSIKCVSINPDYPPFLVPKEDIYSYSLVVGSLSITEM